MSVENFLLRYPADSEFRAMIERQRLPKRSLIATFASMLAWESGDALREATKNLSPELNFGFGLNLGMYPGLSSQGLISYAGVILGASIPPLERSPVDGYFDIEELCSSYSLGIDHTPFFKIKAEEGEGKEVLTLGGVQNIKGVINQDPTFASFFTDNFKFLPTFLQEFLTLSQTLPIVERSILPRYNERARFLVENPF